MLELKNCEIGHEKTLYRIPQAIFSSGTLSAIIGANGSGKSTLIDSIVFPEQKKQDMRWNGQLLHQIRQSERARLFSLVENSFSGFEHQTVEEYLGLGRYPYSGLGGHLSSDDKQVIKRVAERLQLVHLMNRSTLTLSDGERQRTAVARALIQETPVILLDEPTSFLDYPSKRSLFQLFQTLAQEENKVVLVASHDLELCLRFSDNILLIEPKQSLLQTHPAETLTIEHILEKAFPADCY